MSAPDVNLDFTEQAVFSLRALYNRYGYTQYKMGKFEEYDLYARNKDFLISDSVITFTDLNGKLMALKPDVTLSIVKNTAHRPSGLQKLYYNENVYRVSKGAQGFREIMQVGLEAIGQVDSYCISEVLQLAAKSLQCISADAIVDVSHLGLLTELMEGMGIPQEETGRILQYMGQKNLHQLSASCQALGVCDPDVAILAQLTTLSGPVRQVLPQVAQLFRGRVRECTLDGFLQILSALADTEEGTTLHIDFSVVGDLHYYNGIVFKGFILGLPTAVLSGGQYDRLLSKMGRKDRAIGFALYMDMMERLVTSGREYDVDTVLLYDECADLKTLQTLSATLRETGSVLALQQKPADLRYRRLLKLQGSEVVELENNP